MARITKGRSYVDKITFSDDEYESTAIQMSNGEIKVECEKKKEMGFSAAIISIVLFIIICVIDIKLMIPFLSNGVLRVYIFYSIIAGIFAMIMYVAMKEIRKKENANLLKNHGAEHMVFKAYRKLKRIPTVSEAREFSRIDSHCGINQFSAIIIAQLIAIFIYWRTGYIISEILILTIVPMFASIFPFNFIGNIAQFWTTSEPRDSNIRLAISALKGLEDRVLLKEKIHSIVEEIFKR